MLLKVPSEKQVQNNGEPVVIRSVNWASDKYFWAIYLCLIVGFRVFMWMIGVENAGTAWTITNITHTIITFFAFHWVKGTPFDYDQGRFDRHTFWEQIDFEVQNTWTRKVLIVIPIVLFMITISHTKLSLTAFGLNIFASGVIVIAKVPFMHKVRILGINK
ncbi:orm1-like protein [Anaeramoeba ignava]|uniref:Orm1-like protein n=1 Tax=Anaeramoeba ignava TaxID=1746090 RepID=A0A9Q0RGL4_ANAIG|nr:orm1-like protein [Anaeramoeba ignava]